MKGLLNLVLGLVVVASFTQCKKEECEPQKYDDLKVSTDQVTVELGGTETVTIEAGSGDYEVVSLDASRVKASLKVKDVILEGIAIGATVVEITDKKTNQKKSVGVAVVYPDIKLAETKIGVGIDKSVKVKIVAGSGFYQLANIKEFSDYLDVTIDNEKNLVVKGKLSGETVVRVKDTKTEKTADLEVTIGK